jgi:hypothetical protein
VGDLNIKRPTLKGKSRLQGGSNFQTSLVWIGRLLRLDFSAFDDIRGAPTATTSAVLVVYGASLFAGLGSWLWAVQSRGALHLDETDILIKSMIIGSFTQAVFWFAWVYVTYQVLVRAYASEVHFVDLTRTMGFAFAPVAFTVLIAIAGFAIPFGLLGFGITLLITMVAVEYAADIEQREAMVATIAGFAVFLALMGMCANISEVGTIGGISPGILFFSLDL